MDDLFFKRKCKRYLPYGWEILEVIGVKYA